jgi:hypothetical protein
VKTRRVLPIRGILMHLTHYDPVWFKAKDEEKLFDLATGLDAIDAMAEAGLNLLVIDCADGVRYRSHPEFARHYSVPMSALRRLVSRAEKRGIEVVPKLNFARSGTHHHNDWLQLTRVEHDTPEYWKSAFEVVDELIRETRPRRFFHVGMDEDHDRSTRQYVEAIRTLRKGLKSRGLRAVIWNDSACLWPSAEVHREKSLLAEKKIPKDVVEVLWDYFDADPKGLGRLAREGFEVWGAPASEPDSIVRMRDRLLAAGGTGILLTRWKPTLRESRREILDWISTCGPLCR